MENQQFQEDLQYVKSMIENSRRRLIDNGINYLTTAVFVGIGVIVSYILGVNGQQDILPYLWIPLIFLMVIANIFLQSKIQKKSIKHTFIGKIFDAVWLSCGISISIITLLYFITLSIQLSTLFIAISAILGIGYYLTGVINELPFMKYLAYIWWIGTILSLLWNYIGADYQLALLFSAIVVIQQAIPGIIIYRKWRKVNNG